MGETKGDGEDQEGEEEKEEDSRESGQGKHDKQESAVVLEDAFAVDKVEICLCVCYLG